MQVRSIHELMVVHLNEIQKHLPPGVKVSLVTRHVDNDQHDQIMTQDDPVAVAACVDRCLVRAGKKVVSGTVPT